MISSNTHGNEKYVTHVMDQPLSRGIYNILKAADGDERCLLIKLDGGEKS